MARRDVKPRTFFLNEQHELSREEKAGGGGTLKLAPINWASKGQSIRGSLGRVKEAIAKSKDPLKERRYFLLAQPVAEMVKESKDKRIAPEGRYSEKPNYASGEHSRVFQRLGIDLLQVNDDGTATVHATPERVEQLMLTAESLGEVGVREQSRWATIDSFGVIPLGLRIDELWLDSLSPQDVSEAVIELQPLLSRVEMDEVVRAIAGYLRQEAHEHLTGTGTDFSGRQWFRGRMTKQSLRAIARNFFSIQSLHPPLLSRAAVRQPRPPALSSQSRIVVPRGNLDDMPTVALLDTGVPADHRLLAPYRRGQYIHQLSAGRPLGGHGSLVASRLVYGDVDSPTTTGVVPSGECCFYDVLVAVDSENIEDKSVVPSMESVAGTAQDVRVFNLSFDDHRPLEAMNEVVRREKLILLQDLDNFVFARDVLVVIAAGNSPKGTTPSTPYPQHFGDPQWQLGPWARSFNSLTCGATVERLGPGGLVQNVGWPSPFTRVGPGLCDSPKPDFSAHGGNLKGDYKFAPGLGVYGCSAAGLWEDHSGTSFAAPLLAREAAFALHILQQFCAGASSPFAATAKAFLAITASRPTLSQHVLPLAERALGMGKASVERLRNPLTGSAIMIWQGMIEGPDDIVRVQVPIPRTWYAEADSPRLRLVVSWDSPVNAAAHDVWASRRVIARLLPRPRPEGRALYGTRGGHISYPLSDRTYNLRRIPDDIKIDGDMWLLELAYEQIADYFPGMTFSPQQRVSFAAELFDAGETPVSPQAALQSLPIAETMNRLSIPSAVVRTPVILRSRV